MRVNIIETGVGTLLLIHRTFYMFNRIFLFIFEKKNKKLYGLNQLKLCRPIFKLYNTLALAMFVCLYVSSYFAIDRVVI